MELKDTGAKAIRPEEFRQLRTTVEQSKQMLEALEKQESQRVAISQELLKELAALNERLGISTNSRRDVRSKIYCRIAEEWNDGRMELDAFPFFQYSTIPSFQLRAQRAKFAMACGIQGDSGGVGKGQHEQLFPGDQG